MQIPQQRLYGHLKSKEKKIKCEKEDAKFLTNAQSNGLAQGASAGDQSLQLQRKKAHARTVMMANVDVNDNNNNGDNDNNNKDNFDLADLIL